MLSDALLCTKFVWQVCIAHALTDAGACAYALLCAYYQFRFVHILTNSASPYQRQPMSRAFSWRIHDLRRTFLPAKVVREVPAGECYSSLTLPEPGMTVCNEATSPGSVGVVIAYRVPHSPWTVPRASIFAKGGTSGNLALRLVLLSVGCVFANNSTLTQWTALLALTR